MASILVLEDMEERVELLQRVYFLDPVVWAKTVKEFIHHYELAVFDLLVLDHDLGGPWEGSKDEDDQCGLDAVDYLVQALKQREQSTMPYILIWSVNPAGAQAMQRTLRSNGIACSWIPFFEVKKFPNGILANLLP